jgi:tetratricopeptide (TPR) repeat protein
MTFPSRPPHAPTSPRPPVLSPWLQRLFLLVAVPLLFFGLLEGALRLAGFGTRPEFFIPDEDKPGFYCPNPVFTELFLPAHFGIRPLVFRLKKHKDAGCVRVFVLGESAAQGTPEPAFGFAAQLQAQLAAHYAGKKLEVFNLGITAINSHVVYQIARQLPDFEPDLFVVYLGNNEVIGPYGPGSAYLATMPPLSAIRASVWARSLRTGQLLLRLLPHFGGSGAQAPEWRGMETFTQNTVRGNDPRLEAVYGNFEHNLRAIIALANNAGAKTVLSTVVANLKDSSPFVSLHRANLTPAELATWKKAFDGGRLAFDLEENDRARAQLTEARRIDAEYADTHFLLGRLAEARGDLGSARQHYLDALHWDALRFRPDPRVNDIIRRIAREAGPAVQLVDAARAMGTDAESSAPLCGHEFLFEHVHFNWDGNVRLAGLLAEACASFIPDRPTQNAWLSPAESAEALGYTEYARQTMRDTIAKLTGKPPFTNQLTFGEYQTELKREIGRTHAWALSRDGLLAAETQVSRALQRNPQDPFLVIQLENIEFDLQNFDRALELVDQAMALLPRSALLITKKANLLLLFNRPNEAEALLLNSTRTDPYFFSPWPLLVRTWKKTGQLSKGKHILETQLASMPGNNYLRMAYASLLLHSGDTGAAEREWRTILRGDPANAAALEQLVKSFRQGGREAEAETLMAESSIAQPRNYENNARLAQIYSAKGDREKMVTYLRAMTESGPVDTSLYLELAQQLADLNQGPDALVYARRGRKSAAAEKNATLVRVADELLQRLAPPP